MRRPSEDRSGGRDTDAPAGKKGGEETWEYREARGYSWPPFERGHTLSRKHGAYSERDVGPLAEAIAAEEAQRAPWLAVEAFAGHLRLQSRAEAAVELLWRHVIEHGVVTEDGEPNPALSMLDRFMGRAQRLRGEAGLSPQAWAKQLASLSATGDAGTGQLAAQREVGAQILARIEEAARELPAADDGEDGR